MCDCSQSPRTLLGLGGMAVGLFLFGLLTGHLCVEEVRMGLSFLWLNPDLRFLPRFG